MTEEERQLMLETSMAVTMILDRLQWNDIGRTYFDHIEPYLKAIKEAKTRLSDTEQCASNGDAMQEPVSLVGTSPASQDDCCMVAGAASLSDSQRNLCNANKQG